MLFQPPPCGSWYETTDTPCGNENTLSEMHGMLRLLMESPDGHLPVISSCFFRCRLRDLVSATRRVPGWSLTESQWMSTDSILGIIVEDRTNMKRLVLRFQLVWHFRTT
jgi:hypothetical protein